MHEVHCFITCSTMDNDSTSRQIGNNVVYGAPLVASLRNGFSSNMVVVAEEADSMECKFDCHD